MQNNDIPRKTGGEITQDHIDLKSIRESMGITLKDIFQHTRISVGNLEAIENGRFDLLPPPVFAKSFIKAYARFLKIDEQMLLSRYTAYLESLKSENQDADTKKSYTFPRISHKIIMWVVFSLFVTGLVLFCFSSYQTHVDPVKNQIILSPPAKGEGTATFSATHRETQPSTPTSATISPTPKQETLTTTSEKEIQSSSYTIVTGSRIQSGPALGELHDVLPSSELYEVIIEAKELTWLRIITDEGAGQEFLLKPGEKIKKKGTTFHIDVGNAGGTNIHFRGKSLGTLGKHGQVVHLRLP